MTMSRQTLSVTLLAFNEQATIGKCLKSVKSIADEMIVFVDALTTDNTASIAKQLGAKVTLIPHEDNFHINKHKANSQAKSDWVLQLDADEFVTPELRDEIKTLLAGKHFGYDSWQSPIKAEIHRILPFSFKPPRKLTSPASAYYLPRKNFFLNRYLHHTGQYPDPVIRLFQNGKARLPAKDVHEQMQVTGPIGWLSHDLDHYATPEFGRYITRENRYSSLTAHHLAAAHVEINPITFVDYFIFRPLATFFSLYIRYRGFLDGFPGFIFSLFSAIHWQLSYMKLWEIYRQRQ